MYKHTYSIEGILRTLCRLGVLIAAFAVTPTWASEWDGEHLMTTHNDVLQTQPHEASFDFPKDYYFGSIKHRLAGNTKVIGWQLNESWFFGRQKGPESSLALVWQGDTNQFSLSTEGMRVTRHF